MILFDFYADPLDRRLGGLHRLLEPPRRWGWTSRLVCKLTRGSHLLALGEVGVGSGLPGDQRCHGRIRVKAPRREAKRRLDAHAAGTEVGISIEPSACALGTLNAMPKQISARKALICWLSGGEGGIRTRGEFYPTHAFQACDLNRSSTSPRKRAIVAAGAGAKFLRRPSAFTRVQLAPLVLWGRSGR